MEKTNKILRRGDIIHLSKENPLLNQLRISISWDLKDGLDADLDASILILDKNGKLLKEDSIVYYNNLELYDGVIQHSGDVIRPIAEGDETICINLIKLPTDVKIIVIIITIFNKEGSTKRTLECVKNISIKLSNVDNNQALYSFCLTEDASNGTAVEMGRIYLKHGEWRFDVLGEVIATTHNGLQGVINKYNSSIIIDKKRDKTMTIITPIRHRVVKARWKKRQSNYN